MPKNILPLWTSSSSDNSLGTDQKENTTSLLSLLSNSIGTDLKEITTLLFYEGRCEATKT
jgi:hypothetical protein